MEKRSCLHDASWKRTCASSKAFSKRNITAQSGNVQVLGRSGVTISFSQIWNWIGRSVREPG
jgi:hypothetical protein